MNEVLKIWKTESPAQDLTIDSWEFYQMDYVQ